jgi:hypothetical protein
MKSSLVTDPAEAEDSFVNVRVAPWGITCGRSSRPAALLLGVAGLLRAQRPGPVDSWSAPQRIERLKLVVQNRCFLVLADKGPCPNLASQAMGAALRALPGSGGNPLAIGLCWPKASPTRRRLRAPAARPATGSRWE